MELFMANIRFQFCHAVIFKSVWSAPRTLKSDQTSD